MVKQLRIDFPDYPAKKQEQDVKNFINAAKKIHKPTLFVLKVDGVWAHLDLKLNYCFYRGMNLFQMYNKIKQTHPEYRLKYIINQGLEDYLRDKMRLEDKIKAKQLKLFMGENDAGY